MRVLDTIEAKLIDALSPEFIEVVDESHGHNVADDAQSHFKVVVATSAFDGQRAVKRHQMVYGLLEAELKAGVHALALHLYTPSEWQKKSAAPQSPTCLGGGKSGS